MGPSGSGKTTLLGEELFMPLEVLEGQSNGFVLSVFRRYTDVLAGRKTAGETTGNIAFAGQAPTITFLRRHTGYVEQFGELIIRRGTTSSRIEP